MSFSAEASTDAKLKALATQVGGVVSDNRMAMGFLAVIAVMSIVATGMAGSIANSVRASPDTGNAYSVAVWLAVLAAVTAAAALGGIGFLFYRNRARFDAAK